MSINNIKITSPDPALKGAYQDNAPARVGHINELIKDINQQLAPKLVMGNITSADLVGVDGTGSNAAPLVETEARLDAIEAKINAIIAALA